MSIQVRAVLFVGAPAMEISIMKGLDMTDLESEDAMLVFPYPNAKQEDVFLGIPVLESSVYYPYTAMESEKKSLMTTIEALCVEFEQRFGMPASVMISPNIS